MRFTLSTLILLVVFAGGVMGLMLLPPRWKYVGRIDGAEAQALFPNCKTPFYYDEKSYSAAGRVARVHKPSGEPDVYLKIYEKGGDLLCSLAVDEQSNNAFVSDADTVIVGGGMINSWQLYRRQFPEYWWGITFRAEFWMAVLSGFALLVIGVRRLRARRKGVA